jgi:hypothetical protein
LEAVKIMTLAKVWRIHKRWQIYESGSGHNETIYTFGHRQIYDHRHGQIYDHGHRQVYDYKPRGSAWVSKIVSTS